MLHANSNHLLLLRLTQTALLVLVFQIWPLTAMAMDVRAEVAGFLQDYLGRSLTPRELDEAVAEYQGFFGEPEHCNADCKKVLTSHIANRPVLAQPQDSPQALILRHLYLSNAVFNPKNQGGIILKLLAEPDPVVAIDYKSKRLMTKRDFEALLALLSFAKSGELLAPTKLSPTEFTKIKNEMAGYFKTNRNAKIPTMFVIAAELYVGIKRDWANLPESDRKLTLAYLQDQGVDRGLPIKLYQQFLGISEKDAEVIAWKQLSDAISAKTHAMIGLQGQAASIMNMGRSMVNPTIMLE